MSDRKRPLWPLLTAALIALPVLYVTSFGPACWYLGESVDGLGRVAPPGFTCVSMRAPKFYWPLGRLASGNGRASLALRWYAKLGSPNILLPTSVDGQHFRP